MAYDPAVSSIVVFQKDPTKLVGTVSVASIDFGNRSILTIIQQGNTSVQGTMSILGTVPVTQTTSPWVVNVPTPSYISYQLAGSVMAVSGTFSASPQNSIIAIQQAGSIQAVNMPSPSVIAYQLAGSILAVSGSFSSGNTSVTAFMGGAWSTSVQGTMSIVGTVPVTQASGWTTSLVSTVPSSVQVGASVMGTVPVTQTTTPWVINQPSPSIIAYQLAGSILAVSGSFSAGNTSVSAFIESTNTSIFTLLKNSSVATLQGTNPWITQIIGSVALGVGNTSVAQAGAWNVNVNSILGTYVEKNAVTPSAIGIVPLFKIDETNSVLSAVSPQSPFPIRGSVATLQGTNPWQVNLVTPSLLSIQPGGSVLNANISGSVAAAFATGISSVQLMSTSASIATLVNNILTGNSSVQLISTSASIATLVNNILTGNSSVQLISTSASIMVNNKAIFGANNTWTQSDSVMSMGWVRNDTMSSITTADLKYSGGAVGPVGENIIANAPITKWVMGLSSVQSGTSVQVIAPPGASIFTYITGISITNEASIASRVTITQGLGRVQASFLTVLIAPAGGGSNSNYINPIRVLDNNGISASINAVASIYVTITGFTAKT